MHVGLSLELTIRNGAVGEFKQDYSLLPEFKTENHRVKFKKNEESFSKLEGCCDRLSFLKRWVSVGQALELSAATVVHAVSQKKILPCHFLTFLE